VRFGDGQLPFQAVSRPVFTVDTLKPVLGSAATGLRMVRAHWLRSLHGWEGTS
jgi:hypothetical protein